MEQFINCPNYLELTTTGNLLRYVSECDPLKRISKGGYFVGRVNVPLKGEQLAMSIDVVPSADLVEKITNALSNANLLPISPEAVMTHPNLVHHFRFKTHINHREYDKEPALFNHSWKLEYIIDVNQNIRIRNKECILDENRLDVPTDCEKDEAIVGTLDQDEKGYFFLLTQNEGKNKFCLAPLKPKKNADPEKEATIEGILSDRLSNETNEVRDIIRSFYSNVGSEKNANNISTFRLRVQFRTESGINLAEGISSGDIKDTRSTKTGALDIFSVTNKKSCYHGGRKITIISRWDLDKESVRPRLQVYNEKGEHLNHMTEELNQPSVIKEVEVRHIDFLSPSQNEDKIEKILYEMVEKEMRRTGNTIKLLLKRTDSVDSETKVVFQYIPCQENCIYCNVDLDVDGEDGTEEKSKKRKAYPGNRPRTITLNPKIPRIEADTDNGRNDTSAGPSTSSMSPDQNENKPSTSKIVQTVQQEQIMETSERIWNGTERDNDNGLRGPDTPPPLPSFQILKLGVPSWVPSQIPMSKENNSPNYVTQEGIVAGTNSGPNVIMVRKAFKKKKLQI